MGALMRLFPFKSTIWNFIISLTKFHPIFKFDRHEERKLTQNNTSDFRVQLEWHFCYLTGFLLPKFLHLTSETYEQIEIVIKLIIIFTETSFSIYWHGEMTSIQDFLVWIWVFFTKIQSINNNFGDVCCCFWAKWWCECSLIPPILLQSQTFSIF